MNIPSSRVSALENNLGSLESCRLHYKRELSEPATSLCEDRRAMAARPTGTIHCLRSPPQYV